MYQGRSEAAEEPLAVAFRLLFAAADDDSA